MTNPAEGPTQGGESRKEKALSRDDMADIMLEAQAKLGIYNPSRKTLLGALTVATRPRRSELTPVRAGVGPPFLYYPTKAFQEDSIRITLGEILNDNFFPREDKDRWIEESLRILEERHRNI